MSSNLNIIKNKQDIINTFNKKVLNSQIIILSEYRGLSANQLNILRTKARQNGFHIFVLKNTLACRILQDSVFRSLIERISGPMIYSVSIDPVPMAKVLHNFSKDQNALVIKVGFYDNRIIDINTIQSIAMIPERHILISMLLRAISNPIIKMIYVLGKITEKKIKDSETV